MLDRTELRSRREPRLPIATSPENELQTATHSWARELERFVHRYFLVLLIASYFLAALAPGWGQWLRA